MLLNLPEELNLLHSFLQYVLLKCSSLQPRFVENDYRVLHALLEVVLVFQLKTVIVIHPNPLNTEFGISSEIVKPAERKSPA